MCDTCHEHHEKMEAGIEDLQRQHELSSEDRQKIREQIEALAKAHEHHIAETHAQVPTPPEKFVGYVKPLLDSLHTEVDTNKGNVRLILDEILGPVHPLSGERREDLGISHKVDVIWRQSQNGGVQAKLTNPQKVAIWVAAIGGGATIIAAAVTAITSLA